MGKSEKTMNFAKEASTTTDKNNLKYQENPYINQPLINMRYDYDIDNNNMAKSIPVIPKVNVPFGSTSIKDSLNNYNSYKRKYIEKNYQQLNLDKNNLEIKIKELVPLEEYPEIDNPMFKYFMLTKYPELHNFWKELQKIEQYEKKYPLINQLLLNNSNIDKLKYIPIINKFSKTYISNIYLN